MTQDRNQVVFPFDLEIRIEKNDLARKEIEIYKDMDYTKFFGKAYVVTWQKFNPKTRIMHLVFACACGAYSKKEIEKRCETDIRFMWIQNGTKYRTM